MDNNPLYERYQRQMILNNFGVEGQQRLLQAKVLVIGAGGLGCPVLQYLAGAGVGHIGIADDDVISLDNLHRQVLYSVSDIGKRKTDTAARVIRQLNPDITISCYNERFTTANAFSILGEYDIVIDGTDNFSTRYLVNDACVLLNKPLVFGAISQFEGQLSVFNVQRTEHEPAVNYRDLFPDPPRNDEVLNCAEAGVLGVLPGIIGSMMANETIKLITGMGNPLVNELLMYNALNNQLYQVTVTPAKNAHAGIPKDQAEFMKTDYEWLCTSAGSSLEITPDAFKILLEQGEVEIIDVREPYELPEVHEFATMKIPLGELADNAGKIQAGTVIAFCQTGKRSARAGRILSGIFKDTKKVYSLQGGIMEWKKQQQSV